MSPFPRREMILKPKNRVLRAFGIGIIPLLFIWLILKIWVWISPPILSTGYAKEIQYSDGTTMHVFLSPDQKWRLEARETQIPDRMKDWIEWKEDKYFRLHPGFNPVSILKSLFLNATTGKRKSGASTISMQISRLRNQNSRNWSSKLKELLDAIRIEACYSKSELFQYYLNHLPFGGNVEGFRAAALLYFGKEPINLSIGQMAALIVVPNHPNRFHPLRHTQALEKKRNQFLQKLHFHGKISADELKMARLEPLFPGWHSLPREAPHLAKHLSLSMENPVVTTLDKTLQRQMEGLLKQASSGLNRMGIPNAACLLAESSTGAIKVWIGNPDFQDQENSGQVDGVRAIRSPGSTLKPFIYALAMQKGKITPGTILYDIPQDFAGYQPENYDHEFRGAVTAKSALLQSLNLPAIGLLRELGVDSFVAFMDNLEMKTISQKTKKPGLSLAVGGCGTTLFELTQAYCILAANGKLAKLHALKSEKQEVRNSRLQQAACEMVRNNLSVENRSEAILPFVKNKSGYGRIAWKTGTSFGRRDAWCIGFGNRFTLGLWLGDFRGQGNASLSGVDVASPLFQKLLLQAENPENRIPADSFLTQSGWKRRRVCIETGLLPGANCLNLVNDWYLPLTSSNSTCEHIRKVETNPEETISYCMYCRPNSSGHWILADNRPPGYLQFIPEQNRFLKAIPRHNPDCPQFRSSSSLSILSPAQDRAYYLEGSKSVRIPIQILAQSESFPIAILLNGKKILEIKTGKELSWDFEAGQYRITAVDNTGNSQSNQFWVKDF